LALFGAAPELLLNAHLDTVPANSGYSAPPHAASVRGGRLYGLGSADTKGSIAAILQALGDLQAAGRRPRDVAILFSGDEEKGATIARAFIASERRRGLTRAIVCEPTVCRVGHRHRGIASAEAFASSPGGHSSRADQLPGPLAILARAAVALDAHARRLRHEGPDGLHEGFVPWLGETAQKPLDLAFWTEAALYAEAGIDAVVFGPGDITQAHAADEYVEIAQLETAHAAFLKVLG
jgi:acetylornithine deacetylase/succinyl-diaminopimelate desuccinylase-like protein